MPELGLGGRTEKGIVLPSQPWWNAVAINDVPAQSNFYSAATGRLLDELIRDARDPERVKRLCTLRDARLSHRLVREAEEAKIALSALPTADCALPWLSEALNLTSSSSALALALTQPLARTLEHVTFAMDAANETPDVIFLTGGSARSPLIKNALAQLLPDTPIAVGDDFGSVTAGLAHWAQKIYR